MHITFLIGNGFDVGVGLKSKFSDYFPIYCAEAKNKAVSIRALAEDIEANRQDWSYFEKQIGQYTRKFTPETKGAFLAQFRDFETSFITYLRQEEARLSFKDTEKIAGVMLDALQNFYLNGNLQRGSSEIIQKMIYRHRVDRQFYNFLCFNYTSVLENCLKTIPGGVVQTRTINATTFNDRIGRIVHIHGYGDYFPIMGVNDVSQIANQELANDKQFTRFLVKPQSNEVHRTNHDIDGSNLIAESSIICVYGMSLGETDGIWWNRILTWLLNNSDRQLVIFLYDEMYTTASQFDWIEKEDAVMDVLTQYVPSKDATNRVAVMETLRPRIHIAVHKNIFSMDLCAKSSVSNIQPAQEAFAHT